MLCTGTHEVLRVDLFVNKEIVCPICLDSVNVPKVQQLAKLSELTMPCARPAEHRSSEMCRNAVEDLQSARGETFPFSFRRFGPAALPALTAKILVVLSARDVVASGPGGWRGAHGPPAALRHLRRAAGRKTLVHERRRTRPLPKTTVTPHCKIKLFVL